VASAKLPENSPRIECILSQVQQALSIQRRSMEGRAKKIRSIVLPSLLLEFATCGSANRVRETPAAALAREQAPPRVCSKAPVTVAWARRLRPIAGARVILGYNAPPIRVTAARKEVRLARCQFDL
jgi:hypothetical protein